MKEIVILSGKGGTGKTSVTAAFAALAKGCVVVDCDVDAADLHLVLDPDIKETHEFTGGKTARIVDSRCESCGRCLKLCRFGAVTQADGVYRIDPIACEGCGVCAQFCPAGAVAFEDAVNGSWFRSETRVGPMFHARLGAGEENSGKLVTLIKTQARDYASASGNGLILVDGPPGIGCPVIASLSGASRVVAVTEPSVSGIHDLKRVIQLAAHFKTPVDIIINKADINPGSSAKIKRFGAEHGLEVLGEIPYDPVITRAQLAGKSVTEYDDGPVSGVIQATWQRLIGRVYSS